MNEEIKKRAIELDEMSKKINDLEIEWKEKHKQLSLDASPIKIGDIIKNKNRDEVKFSVTEVRGEFYPDWNEGKGSMNFYYHGKKILKDGSIGERDFYIGYSDSVEKINH